MGETLEDGMDLGVIGKTLDKVGVQLLDTNGDLRDMGDVIEDLMEKWDGLNVAQKQGAAVALAGKYQYNNLMALLENSKMYYEQLEGAQDSLGTVDEQNAIYLDSIAAKMNQLQASFEGWIGKLFNPDDMKPFIDQLTNLLTLVGNYTGAVGGVSSLAPLAAGAIMRAGSGAIANNYVNWRTSRARTQQQQINMTTASALLTELGRDDQTGLTEGSSVYNYLRGMDPFKSRFNEQDRERYVANANKFLNLDNQAVQVEQELEAWRTRANNMLAYAGIDQRVLVDNNTGRLKNANNLYDIAQTNARSFVDNSRGYGAMVSGTSSMAKLAENLRGMIGTGQYDASKIGNLVGGKSGGIGTIGKQLAIMKQEFGDIEPIRKFEKAYNEVANNHKLEKKLDVDTKAFEGLVQKVEKAVREIEDYRVSMRDMAEDPSLAFDVKTGEALSEANVDAKNKQDQGRLEALAEEQQMARRMQAQSYIEIAGAIGQMAFAWQSFQSLGSLWTDDDLTIGEKVLNTILVLGTTIPTLVSAFTGIKEAMTALKQAREEQHRLQLESIALNNAEAASNNRLADAKKNTAEAIESTGKAGRGKSKAEAVENAAEGVIDGAAASGGKVGKEAGEQAVKAVAKKGVISKLVGSVATKAIPVIGAVLTVGSVISGVAGIAKGIQESQRQETLTRINDNYSSKTSEFNETSEDYTKYRELKKQYEETGEVTEEYINSLVSLGEKYGIQETTALKAAGAYDELALKVEEARKAALQEWGKAASDAAEAQRADLAHNISQFNDENMSADRSWGEMFADIILDLQGWWIDAKNDPVFSTIGELITTIGNAVGDFMEAIKSPDALWNAIKINGAKFLSDLFSLFSDIPGVGEWAKDVSDDFAFDAQRAAGVSEENLVRRSDVGQLSLEDFVSSVEQKYDNRIVIDVSDPSLPQLSVADGYDAETQARQQIETDLEEVVRAADLQLDDESITQLVQALIEGDNNLINSLLGNEADQHVKLAAALSEQGYTPVGVSSKTYTTTTSTLEKVLADNYSVSEIAADTNGFLRQVAAKYGASPFLLQEGPTQQDIKNAVDQDWRMPVAVSMLGSGEADTVSDGINLLSQIVKGTLKDLNIDFSEEYISGVINDWLKPNIVQGVKEEQHTIWGTTVADMKPFLEQLEQRTQEIIDSVNTQNQEMLVQARIDLANGVTITSDDVVALGLAAQEASEELSNITQDSELASDNNPNEMAGNESEASSPSPQEIEFSLNLDALTSLSYSQQSHVGDLSHMGQLGDFVATSADVDTAIAQIVAVSNMAEEEINKLGKSQIEEYGQALDTVSDFYSEQISELQHMLDGNEDLTEEQRFSIQTFIESLQNASSSLGDLKTSVDEFNVNTEAMIQQALVEGVTNGSITSDVDASAISQFLSETFDVEVGDVDSYFGEAIQAFVDGERDAFMALAEAASTAGDTEITQAATRKGYEASLSQEPGGQEAIASMAVSGATDEQANTLYAAFEAAEGPASTFQAVIDNLLAAGYSLDEIILMAQHDSDLLSGTVSQAAQAVGKMQDEGFIQDLYNQEFLDRYEEPTELVRTAMMSDEDQTAESASAFLPDNIVQALTDAADQSESLANGFSLIGDNAIDAMLGVREFADVINGIGYEENLRSIEELDDQLAEAQAQVEEASKLVEMYDENGTLTLDVDTEALADAKDEAFDVISELEDKHIELDIDIAGDLLDQADLLLETVDDVKDALDSIDDDYTVDPSDLEALVSVFPDILDNAQVTSDGLIQLDQQVADQAILSAQDKLMAELGADQAKLSSAADYAEGMADMYAAQAEAYATLANTEGDISEALQAAKDAASAEAAAHMQEDYANVDAAATAAADNAADVAGQAATEEISASKQSTDIQAENMRTMATNSAKLAAVQINNARAAYQAWASVGKEGDFQGDGQISLGNGISGGTGGAVTVNTVKAENSIEVSTRDVYSGSTDADHAEAAALAAEAQARSDIYNSLAGKLRAKALQSAAAGASGLETPSAREKEDSGSSGSGSSGDSEKELDQLDKEIDRYERVDTLLAAIQADYDRLNQEQDRLIGNGYAENVAKQIDLMEQQIELQKERLAIEQDEAAELGAKLGSQFGITFDDEGFIDNYAEVWKSLYDEVNAYAAAGDEERYNSRKEDFDNFEKWVKNYDTLVSQTIKGTEQDIEDLKNSIEDAQIDLFNKQVDAINSLADINEKFIKFQGIMSGRRSDDPFRAIDGSLSTVSDYNNQYLDMAQNNLNAMMKEVNQYNATGISDIFGKNASALKEAMETVYDQAIDYVDQFEQAVDALEDNVLDGIDYIADKMEKRLDIYDAIEDEATHQQEVIKLLYGDDDYEKMNAVLGTIQANSLSRASLLKGEISQWEDLLGTMKEGTEEYDAILEKLRDARQELNETTEALIERSQEMYKNNADSLIKTFEQSMLGGSDWNDLEWAQQEWELINRNADQYLDDVNKAYNIQKLQSKYLDMLDGNLPAEQQRKVTEQMNQQLKYLREKTNLSEYDVKYAEAQLDILQKQIALEEAQRNKSQMKLRRDSQGNYNYVYTADESAVKDAQSDLLDAENEAYNLAKNNVVDTQSTMLSEFSNLVSQLKAVEEDATMSAEEKQEKRLLLLEKWRDFYVGLQEQVAKSQGDMVTEFAEITALLGENATDIMTDLLNKINEGSEVTLDEIDERVGTHVDNLMASAEEMSAACDNLISSLGANAEAAAEDVLKISQAIVGSEDTEDYGLFAINKSLAECNDATIELTKSTSGFLDILAKDSGKLKDAEQQLDAYREKILGLEQGMSDYSDQVASLRNELNDMTLQNTNNLSVLEGWQSGKIRSQADEEAYLNGTLGASGSSYGTDYTDEQLVRRLAENIWTYGEDSSSGGWGNDPGRANDLASTFGESMALAVQELINQMVWSGRSGELVNYSSSDVGRSSIKRFASGGYTGEWGNEGKLAVLDSKELVLNSNDTENILRAVDIIRAITVDGKLSGITDAITSSVSAAQGVLQQEVHIEASFPNATNADDIREALNGLVDRAAQYAHRTR